MKNDVKRNRLTAAIMASLLVTSVFAMILTFSYNSASNASGPIDIDVTHTLTPITTWEEVYWYMNGCMLIGYTKGVGPANGARAVYTFILDFGRTDNNLAVPLVVAVVALKRVDRCNTNNATNTFYMSIQNVTLAPLETQSIMLVWEEDGTNKDSFPPNHNYTISAVVGVYLPTYAYDNDSSDNEVVWGDMRSEGPLTGDLKIDGIVNILDSIVLGLHFGQKQGDLGWDPNCDLKADGVINILDSIVLGLNFNMHCPGPQYPHPCG